VDTGPKPDASPDLASGDLNPPDLAAEAGTDLGGEAGGELGIGPEAGADDAGVDSASKVDSAPKVDAWPKWPTKKDDGCSCRVNRESGARGWSAPLLLLVLVILIRRRTRG
jgi:MYXO-CTERM domain-containing protein